MTSSPRRIVSTIGSVNSGFCSRLVLSTWDSIHLGVCLLEICLLGSLGYMTFCPGRIVSTIGSVNSRFCLHVVLSTLESVHLCVCLLGICCLWSLAR